MFWKNSKKEIDSESKKWSSHLIELVNVKKQYGVDDPENWIEAVHALRWINFWIDEWAFISIMGPSWCGKSTLMNIVWLLDEPTSGDYLLRWEKVKAMTADERSMIRRTTIWFVFQWYNLLKRMCAREQVALPLSYMWVPGKEKKERCAEALKMVWLGNRLEALPNQLSWWQQQRVCIARALVSNPSLILADEPTGALDSVTWQEILELFQKLNEQQHKTVLLITHDRHIWEAAKKMIRMKDWQFLRNNEE
jgi:putative ABC transport system ATP-binding protein